MSEYLIDMWYIIYNGQQVGPLDRSQLVNYNLTAASMVWHEGMADWQQAGNVPELSDLLSQPLGGESPKYAPGGRQSGQNPYGPQPGYGNGAYGPGYGHGAYGAYGAPGNAPYGSPYGGYVPSGKKVAAGILALVIGGLGIQYFYLGKVAAGFITILLTICTCGLWEIITFIQGIIMLTMTDEQFDRKFVYTDKTFPLF